MRYALVILLSLCCATARATPRPEARVEAPASRIQLIKQRLSRGLRLDQAILEIQGGVNTGVPGLLSVGTSGVFALSGSKTHNKPVIHTLSPNTNLQLGVATGGYAYVPGAKRPHAFSCGGGPWRYKIYDPVHDTPLVGINLPLIGSVAFGPKMFGMSVELPIPFAPGFRWLTGAWLTHPWMKPVNGTIWRSGRWAWTHTAPLRRRLDPVLAPFKLALLRLQDRGQAAWVRSAPLRARLAPPLVKAARRGQTTFRRIKSSVGQRAAGWRDRL